MRYGSGSTVPLLFLDPAAFALVQVHGEPILEEHRDRHADLGTIKHAYLADVLELGRDAALARVSEEFRERCARLPVDDLPAGQGSSMWAAEVAHAYDWREETGREIGRRIERRYGDLGEHEIPGTVDVEGLAPDMAISKDYKSGHRRVTPAKDNSTQRFYALATARTRGVTRARVEIVYVPEDEDPEFDVAEFDAFDLALIAAELRVACERVDRLRESVLAHGYLGLDEVRTGPHCKGCPAFDVCPATKALIAQVLDPSNLEPNLAEHITPANADQARRLRDRIGVLHERLDKAVQTYATVNPFEVLDDAGNPTGLWYGPVPVRSPAKVDGSIAYRVLSEHPLFGKDVADAAAKTTVTIGAIEEAVRIRVRKRGDLSKLQEEALAAIGKAGGVRSTMSTRVKVHRRG